MAGMMRGLGVLLLLPVAPLLAYGQSDSASQSSVLAVTNVTVINTTGKSPPHLLTVVIAGDRISEMGESDKVPIPKGAQVVDGSGKFLMPGLWDMHMHLSFVTELAFPLFIANGVTGVCDMGGHLEQIDRWREQITQGTILGPRIFRAGPMVDGPRTEQGEFRLTATNADEARKAVQSLKERGVDFIKVYHFLSRESYFAVADEAKKQGIPFAGHIPNGVAPQEASDAGQRSLEHTTVLLQALMALEEKRGRTQKQLTSDAFDILAGDRGTALCQSMVRNGTWHTPTLVVAQSFLLRPELAEKADERRKYVAARVKEYWEKNNPVPQNVSPADMADRKEALQRLFEVVGAMRRAGVALLAGTDPPTRDVVPGFSLHDELGLLVKAGLTPMEAIQSATINAAKCLGISDSHGTVEKGKIADPLTNIANTKKITAVVVGGKLFPKASLEEMLEKTEAAVKQK